MPGSALLRLEKTTMIHILRHTVFTLGMLCSLPLWAAGFMDDSKARLDIRNFYYNGDFREDAGVSKRDEWAQGLLLQYESGFTEGTVGLGLDAMGFWGLKLDSSPDRTGSGLLPKTNSGEAAEEYSKGGIAAKIKYSKTVLRQGIALPKVPVLQFNGSRMFPQFYQGTQISSNEITGLSLNVAQFDRTTTPDSTDLQKIMIATKEGRFRATGEGDHFRYGGGSYTVTPALTASYYYGELQDVYRQHFLGLTHRQKWGEGAVEADLRTFFSRDTGAARVGEIESDVYSGSLTYSVKGHSFTAVYQHLEGSSGFPYINNPYLPNYVQYHDFGTAGERSWQVRYGYDFAPMGLPGLSFFTSYIHGSHLDKVGGGHEWERDIDVTYVVQQGLKGLSIRWRNATYRSSYGRDIDENRLIINYPFSFL